MQIEKTLNLSEGFGQCGESIKFKTSMFSAGEVYIRTNVPLGTRTVRINSRVKNSDDIVKILMACDSLQRQGVRYIELFLPYLPYSRQDRVCGHGESFSLKVLAYMLVPVVDKIITYDVHSNAALTLIDQRIKDYDNHREVADFVKYIQAKGKKLALIVPDAGGIKKSQKLFDNTWLFDTIVLCNKKRVGKKVVVDDINNNLRDMTVIVVDDICDGGRTFIELGKKLRDRHVSEMHLFVSHGIFSAGTHELKEMYKCIGTTNSMNTAGLTPAGVKCFELDY
jgi:ribose-phosphate pyrophosphokinase